MRIRLFPLNEDRFALIVDRFDTDMRLDPEVVDNLIQRVGTFAQDIGAAACLVSAEDVEIAGQ